MKECDFHETYNKWIPIEEMLPDINGYYLVTVFKINAIVKLGYFYNGTFDLENVVAWRRIPLPYPYK